MTEGISKTKTFKGMYEDKVEFLRGPDSKKNLKKPSMGMIYNINSATETWT